MAYFLFLLANAALFVRPAELFPALGNIQVYLYLIIAAIVTGIGGIWNQCRVDTLIQQPINLCMLGFTASIATSHLTNGQLALAGAGVFEMVKVLLYFLMLVSVVNSVPRLRQFLQLTVICSSLMVLLSVIDYHDFVAEWSGRADLFAVREVEKDLPDNVPKQLRHVTDLSGETPDGLPVWVFRLRGLGMFHDPNDLASLAAVTAIISLYFLADPKSAGIRYLWLAPLGLMTHAVLMTHSRGGIMAFGVGCMAWLAVKYGGKVAAVIGAMGAAAVPVALGRQGNMEISGGTGQQRIQLWADGLAQLKSMRLPFGIGESKYGEVAGLAAHNSYIHAYVELGFLGGTMFFGCFLFAAWAFYRLKRDRIELLDPELKRMMPYIAGMLAAWCTGMATLSRCYVPPTYMIVGVAAAYINLAGFHRRKPAPIIALDTLVAQRWVMCSVGMLACCFAFVRMFARFG
ncbi:MAG TPA: O-antigen ligase family protein [Caulifigura sp.]|nr:O-antigen ligase family protein [Caulifigura sp.]